MPVSLVYGITAVLPEVDITLSEILMDTELEEAKWACSRFDQLKFVEEKRITALCHSQCYQKRTAWAYDKKLKPKTFKEGDLVLKKILPFRRFSW